MATQNERILQMKKIARPATPGAVLTDLLEALHDEGKGVTHTELASRLGVGRQTISHLLNDKRPLSPDMAQRLGRFFGQDAVWWLRLQQQVDLWDAANADPSRYRVIVPLEQSKRPAAAR